MTGASHFDCEMHKARLVQVETLARKTAQAIPEIRARVGGLESREMEKAARIDGLERGQEAVLTAVGSQCASINGLVGELRELRSTMNEWVKSLSSHIVENERDKIAIEKDKQKDKRGIARVAISVWVLFFGFVLSMTALVYSNWGIISSFVEIRLRLQ